MKNFVNYRGLQLFAEEAAAPESGVTEADAQPQSEEPVGDPGEFEKLIKGPYKQAYDARVKGILQQRLKSTRQTVEAFHALAPTLKLLQDHYGVAEGDYAALEKAIGETYRPVDPAERQRQEAEIQAGAGRMVEAWNAQAAEIQETYPEFDLRKEMENPRFTELLRARIDMRSAYELLHKDEIIPAAMRYAAQTVERKLAENLRSARQRPSENGVSGSPAAVPGSRVAQMTRKEIREACRKVERGEKISFG